MLLYSIALTNATLSLLLLECGHRLRVLPKCFHINISADKRYHSLRTILQFTCQLRSSLAIKTTKAKLLCVTVVFIRAIQCCFDPRSRREQGTRSAPMPCVRTDSNTSLQRISREQPPLFFINNCHSMLQLLHTVLKDSTLQTLTLIRCLFLFISDFINDLFVIILFFTSQMEVHYIHYDCFYSVRQCPNSNEQSHQN